MMVFPGRKRRGFTLLEVMVAVAILGLGLTAILSAQAGAFSMSAHTRNISMATGLARCKMTEIEEQLTGPTGYPVLDEKDTGPCCADDETPNIRCTWSIEKPELPPQKLGDLELDTGLDFATDAGLPDLGVVQEKGMEAAYPQLKDIFEQSSRRVTVKVQWMEGTKEHSIEIVQWVTKKPELSDAGAN